MQSQGRLTRSMLSTSKTTLLSHSVNRLWTSIAMMDYSLMFKYLQTPYTKNAQSFFEMKLIQRKKLSDEAVHKVIYDGLSEAYREHIETCYDQDYLDMDETDFYYETIDRLRRKSLKMKEAQKVEASCKSDEGRKKRSYGKGKENPSKRQKMLCSYCKEHGTRKYWIHNTEHFIFKRSKQR